MYLYRDERILSHKFISQDKVTEVYCICIPVQNRKQAQEPFSLPNAIMPLTLLDLTKENNGMTGEKYARECNLSQPVTTVYQMTVTIVITI